MSSMQLGEVKQDQQPDPRTNLKRSKPKYIDITLPPPQRDAQMWGLKSGFIRLLVFSSPSYISTFPKSRPAIPRCSSKKPFNPPVINGLCNSTSWTNSAGGMHGSSKYGTYMRGARQ